MAPKAVLVFDGVPIVDSLYGSSDHTMQRTKSLFNFTLNVRNKI
jgi:hypothetical protein